MSAADSMPQADAAAYITPEVVDQRLRWYQRLETHWETLGDWVNPILVKETRQALKSRQFTFTFVLLLAACWIWSIGGVALVGPGIQYSASGSALFCGYFLILTFPLCVIVPFSAFRSLAAEREDNTYDLLSITTLSSYQVISGKLGSALLQIVIYFSALAPCLAFTYLLRGIDILTIGVMLVYAFFGSLGLSLIGLLLATLTRHRYQQVVLSVLLIVVLGGLFVFIMIGTIDLLAYGQAVMIGGDVWIAHAVIFTFYAAYFVVIFLAAAANLTFASENRSTPVRWAMFAPPVAMAGWFGYGMLSDNFPIEALIAFAALCGAHWYVLGSLLVGESPYMSARVKRALPQSFLGRLFLSWLAPGPSTALAFVTANMLAVALLASTAAFVGVALGLAAPRTTQAWTVVYFSVVEVGYIVIYLGLGNLLISLIRRVGQVTMLGAALLQVLMLLMGVGIPVVVQLFSPLLRNQGYTLLQVTNPFWTLVYLGDPPGGGIAYDANVLVFTVPALAVAVFAFNLPLLAAELRNVRIAKPQRIVEDDALLAPPVEPVPASPWD